MALGSPTAVVLELMTMGYQSAAYLGELLRAASPTPASEQQELAAEILRCCDRVIARLSAGANGGRSKKRKAVEPAALGVAAGTSSSPDPVTPTKRRARGAEAVREITSGTTADGFIWRKYGQKEINGCRHPRLYYRCAFRAQGCAATRRVQQSQEEPAAFVIAYYGEHTCGGDAAAAAWQEREMPPAVINSGASNTSAAAAADRNMGWRTPALLGVEQRSCGGDAPSETSQGWSPSFSSEVELDVAGFDLDVAGAEAYSSPVWEFLNGSFDWESVINSL
ncbi:probable WRKY transcription factor 70 [Oryza brachyantha]|uniref:WRKY domain-containing protein n=1 Tax=Oryza brachyantha TaxID=4533 RepID=J3L5B1_ORYBR|nr:probable WRKY transcription factor 70 [Oryza brachyantha]